MEKLLENYLFELKFVCNSTWDNVIKGRAILALNEVFLTLITLKKND